MVRRKRISDGQLATAGQRGQRVREDRAERTEREDRGSDLKT